VAPAVVGAVAALVAVPVASLVWKLGETSAAGGWSAGAAARYLGGAAVVHGPTVVASVAWAFAAGGATAFAALVLCWLARDRAWAGAALLAVAAVAWATPGPVAGVGLKFAVEGLIDLEENLTGTDTARRLLYDGPSLLPVAWAWLVRFLPFAAAVLWPAVRLIPGELFESARIDGAGDGRLFREVVWPQTAPAVGLAALAVAALALGELSASKLVATPGAAAIAHEVFVRMHYGVGNQLAALCLVLLAACLVPLALLAAWRLRAAHSSSPP
jgi:ABC-type Fe3+ transport system permease subunit